MNVSRLAIAAIAATIVDAIYGFVVYGNLLTNKFAMFPGVFRPASDMSHMPYLFLGILIGMVGASLIYQKGYEGGSGLAEGVRFGALVGILTVGYGVLVNFAVLNIDGGLTASMAVASFVEWLIVGAVIGLVYQPAAASGRRARV